MFGVRSVCRRASLPGAVRPESPRRVRSTFGPGRVREVYAGPGQGGPHAAQRRTWEARLTHGADEARSANRDELLDRPSVLANRTPTEPRSYVRCAQHVRLDVVFAGLEALRRWSQKNGKGSLIGEGAARSSGREAVVARAGACPGLATADVRRADMALRLPACARTHGRLAGVARDVATGQLRPGGGRGVSSRSCVHRDIHIGRLHRPDGRGMSSGLADMWLLDRVGGGDHNPASEPRPEPVTVCTACHHRPAPCPDSTPAIWLTG